MSCSQPSDDNSLSKFEQLAPGSGQDTAASDKTPQITCTECDGEGYLVCQGCGITEEVCPLCDGTGKCDDWIGDSKCFV